MNTSKDSIEEQDPEYVTAEPTDNVQQQQIYEEIARKNASDKIREIIEREFSREIDSKEEEILLIQDRLHTALKTLQLLRYVIVTDYYNRKQCCVDQKDDIKQTRIHPAIKELLGKAPKNPENYTFDPSQPSTSKGNFFIDQNYSSTDLTAAFDQKNVGNEGRSDSEREKSTYKIDIQGNEGQHERNETGDEGNGEWLDRNEGNNERNERENDGSRSQHERNEEGDEKGEQKDVRNIRKTTLKRDEDDDCPPKKIPRYIPPKSRLPETPAPSRGVRHKVRKRIVVGNISKWLPPEWREDAASHKWMMYVQGSKEEDEDSDIDEFVSKVRFFLHPSYRPNDVVEVTSPPFHLSRRGWGEFPLRVQLHFKNPANKPMDIIHHLKLDRTYTGLQTLGSETVVDIWIKNTELKLKDVDERTHLNGSQASEDEDDKMTHEEDKSFAYIFREHDYSRNGDLLENNVTIVHSSPELETKVKAEVDHECSQEMRLDIGDEISNELNNLDRNSLCSLRNGLKESDELDIESSSVFSESLAGKSDQVMKPLEISIPPHFQLNNLKEPAKAGKKIVLLDDNKVISTNILSTDKSIRPIKGISLLKKPLNSLGNKCKKNSFINIQINPAKSVMLSNDSNVVPALQIAQPMLVNTNKCENNTKDDRNNYNNIKVKHKVVIGKDNLNIWSRKHEFDKVIAEIHDTKIQETEYLIRFILRRIPIITHDASDVEYKRMHPYACKSEKEFLNFHIAKQRALEWLRAKQVQVYLKECQIPDDKIWTTREIVVWCRLHGFTPMKNTIVNIFPKQVSSRSRGSSEFFINTCTESSGLTDWIQEFKESKKVITCSNVDEEIIDVESVVDDDNDKKKIGKIIKTEDSDNVKNNDMDVIQVPKTMLPMYSFVCETARKIGVNIGPEEITPGVSDCTAGKMILRVVNCLMEDLLRLSLAKAWERSNGNYPSTITLNDTRNVILSRDEFDIFTNSGLGSSTID